jgi:hypothetical protein
VIRRPFIIDQEVLAGDGEVIRIELHHENGSISLTVTHELFDQEVNVLLDKDTAEKLLGALDTLYCEQRDKDEYAVESM